MQIFDEAPTEKLGKRENSPRELNLHKRQGLSQHLERASRSRYCVSKNVHNALHRWLLN
jgi:hypothetical protein